MARRIGELRVEGGAHEGVWLVIDPHTGEQRIHEYRAMLIEGSNHILVVELDVTERERTLQELRASEERYRLLVETAREAVLVVDAVEGCYIDGNAAAGRLLGVDPARLRDGSVDPLSVSPKLQPDGTPTEELFARALREAIENGESGGQWCFARQDTGEPRIAEWFGVLREDRHSIRVMAIDVTERLDAEQALRESEAHYRSLVEHSREPIAILSIETGAFVDCNPATALMLGIARDDLIGRSLLDVSPESQGGTSSEELLGKMVAAVTATGDHHEAEWEVIRADGTRATLEFHAALLPRERAIRLMALDITARRNAEVALRASEARYRRMTEYASEAITVLDVETLRFVDGNRVNCELFGVTEEELLTLGPVDVSAAFQPPDGRPVAEVAERRIVELMRDGAATFEWIHRNLTTGEEILCEVRMELIAGTNPPIARASVVDIRERTALQEQLRQDERMKAVGQLAGGVAHDFNNMMGIIAGAAELVLRDDQNELSAGSERMLQAALRTTARASELTSQLTAFSRAETVERTPFRLHEVIRNTVVVLKRTMSRNIEVLASLDAGDDAVLGSAAAVESLLLNVVLNAMQAMQDSGGVVRIASRNVVVDDDSERLRAGTYIEVDVSDTGPGISDESIDRVFEPFYSTKRGSGGTGLGLAAAYGTALDHGGTIDVASAPGKGATFTVRLPCTGRSVPDERPPSGHGTEAPRCVLVVDDEPDVRDTVGAMLVSLGHRVITADDGKQAVATVEREGDRIDVVVMDINMPGGNGWQAIAELQRRHPDCPVIVSSGFAEHGGAGAANVLGYLKKPYSLAELNELVCRAPAGSGAGSEVPDDTSLSR